MRTETTTGRCLSWMRTTVILIVIMLILIILVLKVKQDPLLPHFFYVVLCLNHLSGYMLIWQERSEEHTSELQSRFDLVCRLLLEKKKKHDDRVKAIHESTEI